MKQLAWISLALSFVIAPRLAHADPPPLAVKAKAILQTHCADCHGGGKATKGGFGFVLDRDLLISRQMVTPGKAKESELYLRVHDGDMPPPAKKVRPTKDDLATLQQWINAGAPGFDAPLRAGKLISEKEIPGLILQDLKQIDPRLRRFMRYLTLTHLAYAGRPEKDIQITREGAGKLLNFLSWQARIALPEPINAEGTILRLDLRAYKWTAALWEKVAAVYPYRYEVWPEETRAIASLAGTEIAAVRADWFVATASRPPLYHDLLQMPVTDRALERLLQVDVVANLQDDSVIRAGFNDSGVSKNNRLIERHDATYGAMWRSHDFSGNTGRQNLFEHPLGPNAGETSFNPAGGEIIFHLPNGLHGFMLVDALGRRIDKAPGEIVADPRRPDQRVETGISCMSCHARGLLPKVDQLRPHVEKNARVFGQKVLDSVRAAHPSKVKFQARIDEDNARYLKALEKIGIRDADQEPVNLVTQRFEATLDGNAAAELGISLEEFGAFLKKNPTLARLFGGLVVAGGTVQRQVFQDNFPDMARRLVEGANVKPTPIASASFKGHEGTVNCVAFSLDGQRAASGADDRTIRLWDLATGQEIATLKGSSAEVYAVAFSPDGKYLISAGRDRLLRLWDLQARQEVRVFRGHTDGVRCVAFSPDGKQIVSGGNDNALRVWNTATAQETKTLAGHGKGITSVAWAAKGQLVLSGSLDGTVRWWDVVREKELKRLEGHVGPVLSVALAPDGKRVLSGGNDKTVRYWDLKEAKELRCLKGHENAVVFVGFKKDGSGAFSSSSQHQNPERTWRRWDLNNGSEVGWKAPAPEVRFGCAAFSSDGLNILVGGPGGFLRLWSWQ